jgi:hypothetical protein
VGANTSWGGSALRSVRNQSACGGAGRLLFSTAAVRGHVDELAVGLAVVPLALGGDGPARGALHLAVPVPRDDDCQAGDRALLVLAVGHRRLPLALGVLLQRQRHVEALQEEQHGHLQRRRSGLGRARQGEARKGTRPKLTRGKQQLQGAELTCSKNVRVS